MKVLRNLFSPTQFSPRALGIKGEDRAAWYYRMRGYSILDRNVRLASGEIDLVVKRGKTIAVAEVKTRQTTVAGDGHEAVDRKKRERMIRLGDQWAARHPDAQLRYDIMSMRWTGRGFDIAHYPDAFRPVADAARPWRWRA